MIGCAGLVASALTAQVPRPALLLVPRADTVLVYVLELPPAAAGFVVYRAAPGQPAERITAEPVQRVREPALAAGLLGRDLPAVMTALRAADESEMLRRLHADPFAGSLLSLLYRPAAQVTGRLHADARVVRGGTYEYRIAWTDAAGAETGEGPAGRVVVSDGIPAIPERLRPSAGDHEVVLTWSYPAYRGTAGDLTIGFHVYRGEGAAGPMRRVTGVPVLRDDASAPVFRDREVVNGRAYRYHVTAVDVAGRESGASAVATVTPVDRAAPAVPVGLAVANGDGAVQLVWRLAPEADVAGYHVERATGLSARYTRLTTRLVPADQPTWIDSTVTGGRQYFYRVIAVDAAGNASEPSNAISALPVDRTPPAAPRGLTAAVTRRQVVARWSSSPSRDVLGYHVYRGDAPDRMVRLTPRPLAATLFTDSGYAQAGLRPGARYLVRVTAVDSSFNESAPVTVEVTVPDDEAPGAPASLGFRSVAGRYIEVWWAASPALDVEAYLLMRTGQAAGDSASWRLDRAARAVRDSALVHGRRYAYRLVAIDSAGNRSVAVTDTLTFGDLVPPAAPQRLTARAGARGVVLVWERVASPDLSAYAVYRATLPTGVYERLTVVPAGTLSWTDPAGTAGHYYRVRAVDTSGNESAPSPVAGGGAP